MAGVILPRAVGGSATGWTLTDYIPAGRGVSEAAAGGSCSVLFDQIDPNELWLMTHAVISCTSSTPTSCRWYVDGIDPGRLLDGSDSGNFDVADWPMGLILGPSTALLVVWDGASDGAIGTFTLQAHVQRRL